MEAETKPEERRGAPRRTAKHLLGVWLDDDLEPAGSLKETATRGFRLFARRDVEKGSVVRFRFDPLPNDPHGRPAEGTARCAWSRCRYEGRIWDIGFEIVTTEGEGWEALLEDSLAPPDLRAG